MHRFFTEPENIHGDTLTLYGEDVRHITKVLRLKEDECIEVCDGQGMDYVALPQASDKESLTAKIVDCYPSKGETIPRITLFQGVPKGQKMESIIQKCVEVGVTKIIPFLSKRTVVQLKDKKDKKGQRWQRVAYEAAKQSKRGVIPVVEDIIDLKTISNHLENYDLVLVAYEDEKTTTLKQCLQQFDMLDTIAIIIGPEGGFDSEEIKELIANGVHVVSLGNRILRTETAGVVMAAQIGFYSE